MFKKYNLEHGIIFTNSYFHFNWVIAHQGKEIRKLECKTSDTFKIVC